MHGATIKPVIQFSFSLKADFAVFFATALCQSPPKILSCQLKRNTEEVRTPPIIHLNDVNRNESYEGPRGEHGGFVHFCLQAAPQLPTRIPAFLPYCDCGL
jgi:hypothetical protein